MSFNSNICIKSQTHGTGESQCRFQPYLKNKVHVSNILQNSIRALRKYILFSEFRLGLIYLIHHKLPRRGMWQQMTVGPIAWLSETHVRILPYLF